MIFLTSCHSISHILVMEKPNSAFCFSLYHCSAHLGRGFKFSVILRIKSVILFVICYFRYLFLLAKTPFLMVSRVFGWLWAWRQGVSAEEGLLFLTNEPLISQKFPGKQKGKGKPGFRPSSLKWFTDNFSLLPEAGELFYLIIPSRRGRWIWISSLEEI